METTTNIWDRKPGETGAAYKAFRVYLDLGPDRSINNAYRLATGRLKAKQASGSWRGWAVFWEWQSRAEDYDRHRMLLEGQAAEQAEREAARAWIERREAIRERAWQMGTALLEKAQLMMRFPLEKKVTEKVVKDEVDAEGVRTIVIERVEINAPRWKFSDIARLTQAAVDMMRVACGMPTSHLLSDVLTTDALEGSPVHTQEEMDARLLELLERVRVREAAEKELQRRARECGAAVEDQPGPPVVM